MGDSTMTCVDILLAIILPPLGVFLKFGCQVEFWICVLLTLFGWLPGGYVNLGHYQVSSFPLFLFSFVFSIEKLLN
nr:hydrophobic protein LTI6A-like isoform X1 [Nicotiana tomentosiformis]